MTGTGTQTDPYIVDNWEDFLSVCNISITTYIEWNANAPDKVIDFNNIQPTGFTSTIVMCGVINFNGWVLKNLHSTANYAIEIAKGTSLGHQYISNLNLLNFYHAPDKNSASAFILLTGTNSSSTMHYTYFSKCRFSGQCVYSLGESSVISSAKGSGYLRNRFNFTSCSFNIKVSYAYSSSPLYIFCANNTNTSGTLEHCHICIDLVQTSTPEVRVASWGILKNCLVQGKISTAGTTAALENTSGSTSNCYDIESNVPLTCAGTGVSVYNSDKAAVSGGGVVGCTTAQLMDAAYLSSIGFPIGVS